MSDYRSLLGKLNELSARASTLKRREQKYVSTATFCLALLMFSVAAIWVHACWVLLVFVFLAAVCSSWED